MTAVEALRRARATMDCWTDDRRDWLYECLTASGGCQCGTLHVSALLDGFTCKELTRAERELER